MRKIFLILTLFLVFIININETKACVCTGSSDENSLKPIFNHTENVFQGKVLTKGKEQWKVSVIKVWKGNVENEVYVADTFAHSSCAGTLKKGEQYIFFVSTTNDYSTIDKYKNIGSPIRKNKLQVFFDRPCGFGGFLSNWNKTLENYDKEKFWETLEEKQPIIRKKL